MSICENIRDQASALVASSSVNNPTTRRCCKSLCERSGKVASSCYGFFRFVSGKTLSSFANIVRTYYVKSPKETQAKIRLGIEAAAGYVPLVYSLYKSFWCCDPISVGNAVAGLVIYGGYHLYKELDRFDQPTKGNFKAQVERLREIVCENPENGRALTSVMEGLDKAFHDWDKPKELTNHYLLLVKIHKVLNRELSKDALKIAPPTPKPLPVVTQDPTPSRPKTREELQAEVKKKFAEAYSAVVPPKARPNGFKYLVQPEIRTPDDGRRFEYTVSLKGNVPTLNEKELKPTKKKMDEILSLQSTPASVARCEILGLDVPLLDAKRKAQKDKLAKDARTTMGIVVQNPGKPDEYEEIRDTVITDPKISVSKITVGPDKEKESRIPTAPAEKGSRQSLFAVMQAIKAKDQNMGKIEEIHGRSVDLYANSDEELSHVEDERNTAGYLYERVKRAGGHLVGGGADYVARKKNIYLKRCANFEKRLAKVKGPVPAQLTELLKLVRSAVEADADKRLSILEKLRPITGSIKVKDIE